MATYIALLRAINVGGRGQVSMADLRDFMAQLGFNDARTLLQTGNVVFSAKNTETTALERKLQAEAAQSLGLRTEFFVRSAAELSRAVAKNPFPSQARSDPGHLVMSFLKSAPSTTKVQALQKAIKGREMVRAVGRQLYIVYPDGIGRSKLTAKLMESKLGSIATGRNWNTVLKLEELARS